MLHRLEAFVEPLAASLGRREMRQNVQQSVGGLLSDLKRKNVDSIAYRYDRDRRALQRFIGIAPCDFMPLEKELVDQVGHSLGQSDSVIVLDPRAAAGERSYSRSHCHFDPHSVSGVTDLLHRLGSTAE